MDLPVSLSKMHGEIFYDFFFHKFYCVPPFTRQCFSALLPLVLSCVIIQLLDRKSLERLQFFKMSILEVK